MPENLEKCVKSIKGTNKKTGKPYTREEKYAICNSQLKKGKAEVEPETVAAVEDAVDNGMRLLLSTGRVSSIQEAHTVCGVLLAKSNFDIEAFKENLVR